MHRSVDVQQDRLAFFYGEQPVLRIGRRTDAVVVDNSHFNSGESYKIISLIGVDDTSPPSLLVSAALLAAYTAACLGAGVASMRRRDL